MRFACAVIALLVPLTAQAARTNDELRAAERQYREILRREPESRAAALGLAQVLLWELRLDDAAAVYRRLLDRSPADVDARKGLATAEYWSGDFRSARRDYGAVLRARPSDADARKALADIAAATAPLIVGDNEFVDDNQPLRRARAALAYTFFSDPLTKWTVTAGAYALAARSRGFGRAAAPFASLAGSTTLPAMHLRASGSLRLFRFPDGEARPLGNVALARDWRGSTIRVDVDRHELLYTASSLLAHASETTATLAWSRTTDSASSNAALHAIRDFDDNSGRAADAYHLARVAHNARGSLSVGASVSYRDSDESRFRLIGASAAPRPGGGFAYSYDARYDPYWTPQNLIEARGIVAATVNVRRAAIHLHADGGVGRDRDLVFGPASGTAAAVPLFAAPLEVSRTFHPWRASADVAFPLRAAFTANVGVEHQTTVFYRADSIHIGFTGRL